MLDTSGPAIGRRLREAMDKAGVTNGELAEATGATIQAVGDWLKTGGIARDRLPAIRAKVGCSIDWLLTGEPANTSTGPEIRGKVPIISWVQAGTFATVVDNFQPGQADEWAETTVPIHQHTYALRVRGDSMTNPNGEPTFPDGQVIIVEPDAIDTPDKLVGSLVIVRRAGDDEATFKKLVKDGGRFYLRPLNPQYPMLELQEGDVFCGVVRQKSVRYF
jgi:SOS-response transcriptional repressor LexA